MKKRAGQQEIAIVTNNTFSQHPWFEKQITGNPTIAHKQICLNRISTKDRCHLSVEQQLEETYRKAKPEEPLLVPIERTYCYRRQLFQYTKLGSEKEILYNRLPHDPGSFCQRPIIPDSIDNRSLYILETNILLL